MPPSPQPSPPAGPERPGTLLETDEDILQYLLRSKADVELVGKSAPSAASPAKPPASTGAYRPTQRPPLALLTVLDDGKSEGEVVRLRADRFVIGRSEGDLLIPHDQQISARHIEITRQRSGDKYRWVVTDLQSSNGLFIRVSRTILADKRSSWPVWAAIASRRPAAIFPKPWTICRRTLRAARRIPSAPMPPRYPSRHWSSCSAARCCRVCRWPSRNTGSAAIRPARSAEAATNSSH